MIALITGASSGIGRDMAIYLDKLGYKLILTARNKKNLDELNSQLSNKADIYALDLSKEGSALELYNHCKDKNIDILINNAGFGLFGEFHKIPINDEIELLNLNIISLHLLTKYFLADFKQKDKGYILNVASSAGFLPGPLMASYYASKSYVVSISVAIYEELRRSKSNVHISVLCPGPVATNFNNVAGVKFSFKPISSEYVAKYSIDRMLKNKLIIVPGFKMKCSIIFSKFAPYTTKANFVYNIQNKKIK
jgi:uncharacterized protein